MRSSIQGIIFDLDDTLIPSTIIYEKALRAIGLGLKQPLYLRARQQVKDRLGRRHVSARNRALYVQEVLELQKKFSAEAALRMLETYENVLAREIRFAWKKLRRDLLFRRLARRCKLIILSNENSRTQLLKLRAIDPRSQYFSALITSESVGHEKPHPKMFARALKLAGLRAKQVCMVGDDFKRDIAPAMKLGMSGVLTTEFSVVKRTPVSKRPRWLTVTRLDELGPHFLK